MSERLLAAAALIGAKVLARRLLRRREKPSPPPPPREREREEQYTDVTHMLVETLSRELGRRVGYPIYMWEVHDRSGWDWPWGSHPELGDPERWREYAKKRLWIHADFSGGNLLSPPLISGTTAIVLTRDGRLFPLPHGRDDFETVTNLWEPLLNYIEQRAREISAREKIPFDQALEKALREADLHVPRGTHPLQRAEWAIYDSEFADKQKKLEILRALKRIYMDELGLDWMPLPSPTPTTTTPTSRGAT